MPYVLFGVVGLQAHIVRSGFVACLFDPVRLYCVGVAAHDVDDAVGLILVDKFLYNIASGVVLIHHRTWNFKVTLGDICDRIAFMSCPPMPSTGN